MNQNENKGKRKLADFGNAK